MSPTLHRSIHKYTKIYKTDYRQMVVWFWKPSSQIFLIWYAFGHLKEIILSKTMEKRKFCPFFRIYRSFSSPCSDSFLIHSPHCGLHNASFSGGIFFFKLAIVQFSNKRLWPRSFRMWLTSVQPWRFHYLSELQEPLVKPEIT